MRSSPPFGPAPGRGVRFANGSHPPNRGPNRFRPQPGPGHGRHRGFNFVPDRNTRYRYPLYYGGYYSPWYWDWYGSSYDSQDSSDSDYSQLQMSRQIDELSQEVQRLREQQEYSQAWPAPAPSSPPGRGSVGAKVDAGLPIVLVFLDKRIQEIKNYAVINETLMVFDGQRTKKIALADLDLAATMKLNDERGVDFQIPN